MAVPARSPDGSPPTGATPRTGDGFVRVCGVAEVPDDGALAVEVGDTPVAVVRACGTLFAIRDVCSHADIPLSEGEVDGCTLECWLHGSRFDLRTGEPTGLPATEPVPVYPVRVDGDDVLVDLSPRDTGGVPTSAVAEPHLSPRP